jgi:putative thioredoxin
MSWIREVTDEEFQKEVVDRSHEVPVLVDFWAAWCGPCRVLGPILERLANEAQGKFVLAKIDVDRSPRHAQAFGVRGIPTVIAFRNGAMVAEFSGALPEESVREFLRRLLPSEADALVARAEAMRKEEPEDSEAAEALYREALSVEALHPGATVGLGEMLAGRGEVAEASALVSSLVPGGPLAERIAQLQSEIKLGERRPGLSEGELQKRIEGCPEPGPLLLDLGKLLAAEKRYPEALEALLKAAQSDRKLAEGEAKELMVEIFHVIGVRSPIADEYRTRLTRVLY